ncbi:hypothetical protein HDU76_010834, partial [Blyttiomyces sp. JEL0837]
MSGQHQHQQQQQQKQQQYSSQPQKPSNSNSATASTQNFVNNSSNNTINSGQVVGSNTSNMGPPFALAPSHSPSSGPVTADLHVILPGTEPRNSHTHPINVSWLFPPELIAQTFAPLPSFPLDSSTSPTSANSNPNTTTGPSSSSASNNGMDKRSGSTVSMDWNVQSSDSLNRSVTQLPQLSSQLQQAMASSLPPSSSTLGNNNTVNTNTIAPNSRSPKDMLDMLGISEVNYPTGRAPSASGYVGGFPVARVAGGGGSGDNQPLLPGFVVPPPPSIHSSGKSKGNHSNHSHRVATEIYPSPVTHAGLQRIVADECIQTVLKLSAAVAASFEKGGM